MVKTIQSDVLVIGGGFAAGMAAVEAAGRRANTVLVDKGTYMKSGSSARGLGGTASLFDPNDSPEKLFNDFLITGHGLNEQNLIWEASKGAAENQQYLENIGFRWVRKPDGSYWNPPGLATSTHRELYVERTPGYRAHHIVANEVFRRGVRLFDNVRITKILGDEEGVSGAIGVSRNGSIYLFESKTVILAAGGANNIYPNSCASIQDPAFWTVGDAFNLAIDMGVPLIDMEFPNFREGGAVGIRMVGGYLHDAQGNKFMHKYGGVDTATRGKLVEAIFTEIYEGRGPIYWQLPEKIPEMARNRWPSEYVGMDGKKKLIEIDYQSLLGGAKINERAETPVKGLYAAGESAGGFHGSDRMMSVRMLEQSIFGVRAGRNAAKYSLVADVDVDLEQVRDEIARLRDIKDAKTGQDASEVVHTVRDKMWKYCSVTKEADEMNKCLDIVAGLKEKQVRGGDLFAAIDAITLLRTAEILNRASLMREESRGMHVRRDFPKRDDANWLKHVAIVNKDGKVTATTMPITKIDIKTLT